MDDAARLHPPPAPKRARPLDRRSLPATCRRRPRGKWARHKATPATSLAQYLAWNKGDGRGSAAAPGRAKQRRSRRGTRDGEGPSADLSGASTPDRSRIGYPLWTPTKPVSASKNTGVHAPKRGVPNTTARIRRPPSGRRPPGPGERNRTQVSNRPGATSPFEGTLSLAQNPSRRMGAPPRTRCPQAGPGVEAAHVRWARNARARFSCDIARAYLARQAYSPECASIQPLPERRPLFGTLRRPAPTLVPACPVPASLAPTFGVFKCQPEGAPWGEGSDRVARAPKTAERQTARAT